MINSLYGGMALKSDEIITHITFSEEEFINIQNNTNLENFYKINDCFIINIKNDYKSKKFIPSKEKYKNRNVSYASAIASKGRIKLFKALNEVINNKGRILYCDTDSIFAAYEKEPKKLSFEWIEDYDDAVFISSKTYATKGKEEIIKIKGINEKNLTFEEIKEKFYKNEKIEFKNQLNFRKKNLNLKQFYISKEILLDNYDKRVFTENKKSTKPLEN